MRFHMRYGVLSHRNRKAKTRILGWSSDYTGGKTGEGTGVFVEEKGGSQNPSTETFVAEYFTKRGLVQLIKYSATKRSVRTSSS